MNLKKLFLTYGFGSIGSVARVLTRSYIAFRKKFTMPHREALLAMIENRFPKGKDIFGSDHLPESKELIVDQCHEDLREVILYLLSVENKGVRKVIDGGHRLVVDISEVVDEIVKKELKRQAVSVERV